MLAGAIQQWLKATPLSPVYVSQFGDNTGSAAYAVAVFPDQAAEFDGAYFARVQLRARASNEPAAQAAARTAMTRLLAADGQTVTWDASDAGVAGGTDRSYTLEAISRMNGPTWFPTAEPGEVATVNLEMFVTEV
jgi:hypothetical protein